MARKYSRDNRGRFASGGTGATARGGRLKTASGGKRATQTSRMSAAPKSGTVAKPKGLKRGAVTARVRAKAVAARPARTDRIGDQLKAREAAKGAKLPKRKDAMDVYTGGMGAMRGAKARSALDRNVMSDGKLLSTRSLIEAKVKAGYSVSSGQKGQRLMSADGRYLTEKQVTKTGIGYAKLLSSARDARRGSRIGGKAQNIKTKAARPPGRRTKKS